MVVVGVGVMTDMAEVARRSSNRMILKSTMLVNGRTDQPLQLRVPLPLHLLAVVAFLNLGFQPGP